MRGANQTYRIGTVCGVYSDTVEEESHSGWRLALTVAEGVHQFLQCRRALDLEENFVVVVGHFDIQVFRLSWGVTLVPGASTTR